LKTYKDVSYCKYCGSKLEKRNIEGRERDICTNANCGAISYNNPIPATALIVPHPRFAEKIILVKRACEPAKGEYCLPGGFQEIDETPEQCAIRELCEETNLKGEVILPLGLNMQFSPQYFWVLLTGYQMKITSDKMKPGDDAEEAGFFDINNLPPIAFEGHTWFLERYKEKWVETKKLTINEKSTLLIMDMKDPAKRYLVPISRKKFSTKGGTIDLMSLVGSEFGRIIKTHLGEKLLILKPTLYDNIMLGVKRQTQIIYPKDSPYIALWLGLRNGYRVFECGSGSGAMTIVLANAVSPNGKVISYESDERFYKLARKNIEKNDLSNSVDFYLKDLSDGITHGPFDAGFIDIKEPWEHIEIIWEALNASAPIAFVLPTTNQISQLLQSLKDFNGFMDIQVCELLLRFYKTVPQRLRPKDRMVAHTAYMIFARKILKD
jgi:tRNA (adenine57-N1/adenine58-N1)-methyltransferase